MKYIDPLKESGVLYKVPGIGDDKFNSRYFLSPIKGKRVNGDYFQGVPVNIKETKEVPYPNFFDFEKEFNSVGYEGDISFGGGKKPIKFIQHFVNIGTSNKNALILDFFAGSGSTAEAIMNLNSDDKGSRKTILVTNNEEIVKGKKNKIMMDACYPRVKNAINGYKKNKSMGGSIKYYKTDFVGKNNILNATDKDKIELACNAGELLALAENTLDLIQKNKYYQIFKGKEKSTAIYFREETNKFDDFIDEVLKLKQKVSVYIFSWESNEDIDEFEGCKNVKVKTIPKPILEIYKQIYNLI
jgi:adenine-specific DNA-methyltransferase